MHIGPQLSTYRSTYLSNFYPCIHPYLNSSIRATMLCPGQWLEGKTEEKERSSEARRATEWNSENGAPSTDRGLWREST